MLEIIILILIGTAAGFMSGLSGIGGGLVVIPALVLFLDFSQKQAQGTSLGLLLPPVGILAVINYYKAGFVDLKAASIMALAFIISSYYSSKLAISLPAQVIKKIFAVFLLIYAIKIFLEK
jgi:hypothetical protein